MALIKITANTDVLTGLKEIMPVSCYLKRHNSEQSVLQFSIPEKVLSALFFGRNLLFLKDKKRGKATYE